MANTLKATSPKTAVKVASMVAFMLAGIKLFIALKSGSLAVLASAVDSLMDFGISLINYFAIRTSEKKQDSYYNYGRGKIEGLASFAEGIVIALSSLFIMAISVKTYYSGGGASDFSSAFAIMSISSIITLVLVLYLSKVKKSNNSLILNADLLHYKADFVTNIGVVIGTVIILYTNYYIVDIIMSFILGLYILFEAWGVMKKGFFVLMDRAIDEETTQEIEKIINNSRVQSYHFLKTRTNGSVNFVDVHLVFNESILLKNAHEISDTIENKIKKLGHQEWIITTHLDPVDDKQKEIDAIQK